MNSLSAVHQLLLHNQGLSNQTWKTGTSYVLYLHQILLPVVIYVRHYDVS